MTSRRRRLERLIQQMINTDAHNLAHSRGLAAILRWEKAHPEPDDHDPLADYEGDGSDLVGLSQLLFEYRQERCDTPQR